MKHEINTDINNQVVVVSPGDTVEIVLDENPSTGYRWTMEETSALLNKINDRFQMLDEQRLGSTGQHIFLLQIEQTGTVEIHFKYGQRWTGNVAKTFHLQLVSVS